MFFSTSRIRSNDCSPKVCPRSSKGFGKTFQGCFTCWKWLVLPCQAKREKRIHLSTHPETHSEGNFKKHQKSNSRMLPYFYLTNMLTLSPENQELQTWGRHFFFIFVRVEVWTQEQKALKYIQKLRNAMAGWRAGSIRSNGSKNFCSMSSYPDKASNAIFFHQAGHDRLLVLQNSCMHVRIATTPTQIYGEQRILFHTYIPVCTCEWGFSAGSSLNHYFKT